MVLADTGVLYGAADRDDPRHDDCAGVLDDHTDELLVPVPVIVETAWLIEARLGPTHEATFLQSVTSGELERVDLTDADWARTLELVETYADLPLGLVDATVIAVAERLGITQIATLDHRHFRVVRPRHTDGFELLP